MFSFSFCRLSNSIRYSLSSLRSSGSLQYIKGLGKYISVPDSSVPCPRNTKLSRSIYNIPLTINFPGGSCSVTGPSNLLALFMASCKAEVSSRLSSAKTLKVDAFTTVPCFSGIFFIPLW